MATYCEKPILLTGMNFRVAASTERASLLIYSGAISRPFAVEFEDADSLDYLIEQLTRARCLAWPDAPGRLITIKLRRNPMNKKTKTTTAPVGAQTEAPASEWPAAHAFAGDAIPVDLVDPNPEQPRQEFDEAELRELSDSIKKHGVIQAITVEINPGPSGEIRYTLHDGERRLRASRLAGLATIPAIVVPPGTTPQGLLIRAIVANDQRADLSPIERAKGYQKLADEHGLLDSDIATQTGKSRSLVANTRRLLGLPAERQQQVASGELSERSALALLPLYQFSPAIQEKLSQSWQVTEVLRKPDGFTSDAIRGRIKGGLEYVTRPFRHFNPEETLAGSGGGVRHSLCTDCPLYIKIEDELRCADGQCYDYKVKTWLLRFLEQAKELTGLNYVGHRDLNYNQYTEFDSGNLPILEHALACKCPNLVLRATPYEGGSARPEGVSKHICYICLHPGKGEKSCKCRQAIEGDKTAAEKLQKAQIAEMKKQITTIVVAELEKCTLPALKAMAVHLIYQERTKIRQATEIGQVTGIIANALIEREIFASDPKRYQAQRAAWFKQIGLDGDSDASKVADLSRRLTRLREWLNNSLRQTVPVLAQISIELTEISLLANEEMALRDTGSDADRTALIEAGIIDGIDFLKPILLALQPIIEAHRDEITDEIEHVAWLAGTPAGDVNFKGHLDQVQQFPTLDYVLALGDVFSLGQGARDAIERRRRKLYAPPVDRSAVASMSIKEQQAQAGQPPTDPATVLMFAEIARIKTELGKINAWLAKPDEHANQKLLNRSIAAADLALEVNVLIREYGQIEQLTSLLVEAEAAESACMTRRRELAGPAVSEETTPSEPFGLAWREIPFTGETCGLCGRHAKHHLLNASAGASFHLCERCYLRYQVSVTGHVSIDSLKAVWLELVEGMKLKLPAEPAPALEEATA